MTTGHPRGEIPRRRMPHPGCPAHGPQCSPTVHSPNIVFQGHTWFRQDDVKRPPSTACEVQPLPARRTGCRCFGCADRVVGLGQRCSGRGDARCRLVGWRGRVRFLVGGVGFGARVRWHQYWNRRVPAGRRRDRCIRCHSDECAGHRRSRRGCNRSADVVLGSACRGSRQIVLWLRRRLRLRRL